MKLNTSKLIFFNVINMSTIISFSVNNWLTMWILMELTLFMFIPLMSKNKINDQSMKYFIIQSFSSYLFMFSMLMNSINETSLDSLLTLISLSMKVGLSPFHLWKPEIMTKLSWKECILLTTLIKITPMILINKIISLKMITLPLIFNLIVGSASGLNQLNLKKMMAFSSVFNLSWMISSFLISKKILLTFLTMYFILNFKIMTLFKENNVIFKNQLLSMNIQFKTKINMLFLSISGLPPLTGFLPKLIILNELMKNSMHISIWMILTSITSIYMYIQMNTFSFTNFFLKKKTNKFFMKKNFTKINLLMFPMMMYIWMN
uniref:NADH-ubiquinone oxidoreductase chain 2 n=1 Tax=Perkinsiella saccharicida TaxID=312347 RepID=A0A7S4YYS1_9HEMI|nr:NADH dehydrogenase subunit 2 [Perkinsiella saccharicida]QBZ38030.1 NADH dehydrogenase subunit 2 [Perkinsiella saccharicida]